MCRFICDSVNVNTQADGELARKLEHEIATEYNHDSAQIICIARQALTHHTHGPASNCWTANDKIHVRQYGCILPFTFRLPSSHVCIKRHCSIRMQPHMQIILWKWAYVCTLSTLDSTNTYIWTNSLPSVSFAFCIACNYKLYAKRAVLSAAQSIRHCYTFATPQLPFTLSRQTLHHLTLTVKTFSIHLNCFQCIALRAHDGVCMVYVYCVCQPPVT